MNSTTLLVVALAAGAYLLYASKEKKQITAQFKAIAGGEFPAGSAVWYQKGVLQIYNPFPYAIKLSDIDVYCATDYIKGSTGNTADAKHLLIYNTQKDLDIPANTMVEIPLNIQMNNPSDQGLLFSNRQGYAHVDLIVSADVTKHATTYEWEFEFDATLTPEA